MRLREVFGNKEGFSFIENMIAIVLLCLGALSLLSTSSFAVHTNRSSRMVGTATALALEKMENIKGETYEAIVLEDPAAVTGHPGFTRQVVVTDNSPVTNTKTIAVIVSWNDTIVRTVRMETIIHRPSTGV